MSIRSRQVPVWRGLISIVLSVINSGPNIYYGIDRIPVCTGSGMYRLHCTRLALFTVTDQGSAYGGWRWAVAPTKTVRKNMEN